MPKLSFTVRAASALGVILSCSALGACSSYGDEESVTTDRAATSPTTASPAPSSPSGGFATNDKVETVEVDEETPARTTGSKASTCISWWADEDEGEISRLATFEMATGKVTLGPATPLQVGSSGIGAQGDDIYTCSALSGASELRVQVVARSTGKTTTTKMPCDAVTADEEGIWVATITDADEQTGDISLYENRTALEAKRVKAVLPWAPGPSSFGPGKDALLATPDFGSTVTRIDRKTGTPRIVRLAGFENQIAGASLTSGNRIAVLTSSPDRSVAAMRFFDVRTGEKVGEFPVKANVFLSGLSCTDAGDTAPPEPLPSDPK